MAAPKSSVRIPHLPPEILSKIAQFSVSHWTPDYHSWLDTRLVSRLFKHEVEKYFLEHYLKYTSLHFDLGFGYDKDNIRVLVAGAFQFEKLDESDDSRAVMWLEHTDEGYKDLFDGAIKSMLEKESNCSTDFIVTVRRMTSDIPLFNLKCDYIGITEIRLSFDWRSYFTVLMSEEKELDPSSKANLDEPPPIVQEWKEQVIRGELTMEKALSKILDLVEPMKDSGYRTVRRKRQKRLLNIVKNSEMTETMLEDMCREDEDRTMERFEQLSKLVSWNMAFADDESDEGEDLGSGEEWEDEDDDDDDDEDREDEDDDDNDEQENRNGDTTSSSSSSSRVST